MRPTASLASFASIASLEDLAGQCGNSDLDSLWAGAGLKTKAGGGA